MNRAVAAEWLDQLPAGDERAIGSRRDLRRLNFWMGNGRIIRRVLASCFDGRPPRNMAEVGSGDGALLLEVARGLRATWPPLHFTLIDRQPAVSRAVVAGFEALACPATVITEDVFAALERAPFFDAVAANLFLHHFATGELSDLLRRIAERTSLFVACEPRRSIIGIAAHPLIRLLGCNAVTRNDAALSVRAGFRGRELSALWPAKGWIVREHAAGLFGHLFVAQRRPV